MKKLFFILALAALCGAAFANNISDPEVMLTDWHEMGMRADVIISDHDNGKGFTAEEYYIPSRSVHFGTQNIVGWVFDENEPICLTIEESDAVADDDMSLNLVVWFNDDDDCIYYRKPYTGVGEYVFTTADVFADFTTITPADAYGQSPDELEFDIYNPETDDAAYLPAGGKFTATFAKVDKPETVVPEPASAAYALLGLGSLLGIKRRIKK